MWSSFLVNLQVCRLIARNFTIKWTPLEVFFATILKNSMLSPCIDLSSPHPPINLWRAPTPNAGFPIVGAALGAPPSYDLFRKPLHQNRCTAHEAAPPLQNKALPPIWKTKPPHWNVKHPSIKWFLEKAPPMYWIKPPPSNFEGLPQWGGTAPPCSQHLWETLQWGWGETHPPPPYVLKTCGKPCLFGHTQIWSLVKQLNTIPVFFIKSAT